MLVLNVAPVERGPLLSFDVSGPLGPAFLLPRTEIAEREAHFLSMLAQAAGVAMSDRCQGILTATLGLVDSTALKNFGKRRFSLRAYLTDGLGRQVEPATVEAWDRLSSEAGRLLRDRVSRQRQILAPLDPVLAVPAMLGAPELPDGEITGALQDYVDFLATAAAKTGLEGDVTVADDLLNSIADYAISFDLLVATRVPLDEPFLVTYAERRALQISWFRHRANQEVVLADARSNHVTIEAKDPNTKITKVKAHVPGTREQIYGGFSGRRTDQYWTTYASDLDRDYRASLTFQVKPLARLEAVPYAVSVALLLLTAGMWKAEVRQLSQLALIAGPSALAASVLLARESTTLGTRLRGPMTWAVAGSLGLLVASAVALFLEWSPTDAAGWFMSWWPVR
ncbi:hypothetical protein [Georgenia yuyongxinii]